MRTRIRSILTLKGFSRAWAIAICVSVGVLIGLGVVVARIANAAAYLSNAPETCMNCHVMTDAYATWERGSHGRRIALCVDCHLPHENIVARTAFKSMDGVKHSYVFTVRAEPQVLKLSEGAVPVVQSNCIRCHSKQLIMIRLPGSRERTCWDCHTNIHGKTRSLSPSPHVLRPKLPGAGLVRMKRTKEANRDLRIHFQGNGPRR